jgi:hypothetical protein
MASISTLRDDFNDNSINPQKWVVVIPSGSLTTVTETGGQLEIRPPAYASGWHTGGVQSTGVYDLTGSMIFLEVPSVLAGNTSTMLRLEYDSTSYMTMSAEQSMYAGIGTPGQGYLNGLPGYNPVAHRWWRIRHDSASNLIHWETSPDGSTWSSRFAEPPRIPITALRVLLLGYYSPSSSGSDPWDPGAALFDNLNLTPLATLPVVDRRQQAYDTRVQAAAIALNRPHPAHANNGEESDYPYVANYSKGLQHDAVGDVVPASYQSLLNALTTRNPADFEAILLGPGGKKLINPQAGLAFDLEGPDTHAVTQPPAPRIDSPQNSAEMGELYWMALARDVHFNDYGSDAVVQAAIASLNTEFSDFRGPKVGGQITTQTVFRGIFPGETVGPYLSQFLLKGNSDPRLPWGFGGAASDGMITYGELKISQRQVTVLPGVDYLTGFNDWLDVQNGWDRRGQDQVDTLQRRFVRNLRDLGERVHFDNVADHFFNACLILLHETPGDQLAGTGVIGRDMEFAFDQGNPYLAYTKQAPFATLGSAHALTLVWELLTRTLRAVWFQKWFVHRRLRPEEFGGRIDNHLTGRRTYSQIDGEILASLQSGGLAPYFGQAGERFPTYLLPQAFPEGAPTHPAYGAGHATGSGACATILKAFFNEDQPIESPYVPSADGTALNIYWGADRFAMTVGGEINKLAGNIALGRNAAGVHWRSDYDQSLLLGEQVAIGVLQEQSLLLNEPEFYQLTKFNGTTIRIHDGTVSIV